MLLSLSHPVRVAEEIATLDVISNGRVEFGVGRGSIPTHFTGYGIQQSESRERMLESLDIILQSWRSDRFSFRGRFWTVENAAIVPKPVQQPHPPVRIATNSAETFEWAGQQGYPILVASQVNPFRKIKELLAIYRQAREAAGHGEPRPDDITLLGPLYVAEDQVQLRRELEPSIRRFLQSVSSIYASAGPLPEGRLREVLERVRQMTYEKMCEVMAIFETPDACIERLKQCQQDFGIGRMICWFNPGGMVPHEYVMRSMELFARKVMPQF